MRKSYEFQVLLFYVNVRRDGHCSYNLLVEVNCSGLKRRLFFIRLAKCWYFLELLFLKQILSSFTLIKKKKINHHKLQALSSYIFFLFKKKH